jgi:predicted XRE-type DNA-binding protein
MVDGLSQDRVSKIFSGQVGHMTIDKLIEILSALEISVTVKAKAA